MVRGSRVVLVLAAAIVMSVALCCVSDDADAPPSVDQDLVEQYPYADYILSENNRSTGVITYKVPSESSATGYTWSTRTVSYDSSLYISRLSDVSGSITVVMTGGSYDTLTIIQVDVVRGVSPVDVRFEMYGGNLDDLKVLTVPSSLNSAITNSYTLMFSPLGTVELDLRAGSIGDLIPTEDMVASDGISISIGSGMSIDRAFPSGTNGRHDQVSLALRGGSVGYMTNLKSVVGSLEYRLESGTVEYFCIGADTEYGTNSSLSSLNTFYVQEDVSVYIDSTVSIRMAILGAGIIDSPSVLWNGDTALETTAKNVYIEAPSTGISTDRCFMSNNRAQNSAYQFSGYSLGSTPRTRSVSTDVYVMAGSSRVPVYGGVWESPTDMTLPTGFYMYTNASISVPSESVFTVSPGGLLVVVGHIYVTGVLQNGGTLINSGIIEKSDGGSYEGNDPEGDGYLAYCINVSPTEGSIDVMASDDDTVMLRTESTVYVSRISVLLESGDREVAITAPDTMYVGGNAFMVALRALNVVGMEGYELSITGIEASVLDSMEISVTVPMPEAGSAFYIYKYDPDTREYTDMEVTDTSYREITFIAEGTGQYYVSTVPPESGGFWSNNINTVLAVAIVLVGAAVVYILLRRD